MKYRIDDEGFHSGIPPSGDERTPVRVRVTRTGGVEVVFGSGVYTYDGTPEHMEAFAKAIMETVKAARVAIQIRDRRWRR